MATKWAWLAVAGLSLLLTGGSPAIGRAAQNEPAGQPPSKAEQAQAVAEQPKTAAQTAAKAPEAPASPAAAAKALTIKRPAGLIGNVVAVTPASRTIVVDVPEGKETLRIGAAITDHTKILVGGREAELSALKEGERVRIAYYRTNTGDVATSLMVLRSSMG